MRRRQPPALAAEQPLADAMQIDTGPRPIKALRPAAAPLQHQALPRPSLQLRPRSAEPTPTRNPQADPFGVGFATRAAHSASWRSPPHCQAPASTPERSPACNASPSPLTRESLAMVRNSHALAGVSPGHEGVVFWANAVARPPRPGTLHHASHIWSQQQQSDNGATSAAHSDCGSAYGNVSSLGHNAKQGGNGNGNGNGNGSDAAKRVHQDLYASLCDSFAATDLVRCANGIPPANPALRCGGDAPRDA